MFISQDVLCIGKIMLQAEISEVWSLTAGLLPLLEAAVVRLDKELTVHLADFCHHTTEHHCSNPHMSVSIHVCFHAYISVRIKKLRKLLCLLKSWICSFLYETQKQK